jgi:hypothetical protein
MVDGRAIRLVLEVALLVALAVVLGLAGVRPVAIVAAMALAWLIVALVEWLAWREVPHYAGGSPPRYYLPPAPLPPAHPIEQTGIGYGYPRQRELEAPTWIAPPELRAEVAAEWPVAGSVVVEEESVAVGVAAPEPEPEPEFAPAAAADDPWHVQQLPSEPAHDGDVRLASHRIDPFPEPGSRRLFRRRAEDGGPKLELPVLPRHGRPPRPGVN